MSLVLNSTVTPNILASSHTPVRFVSDEWFHSQVVGALVGRCLAWVQEAVGAPMQPARSLAVQRSR